MASKNSKLLILVLFFPIFSFASEDPDFFSEIEWEVPFLSESIKQRDLLESLNITVSKEFSPSQREIMNTAIALLPACQQKRMRNLKIRYSAELDAPLSDCTEGYYPGDGSIILYPRCSFGIGIIVHESFHHLGRFDRLNQNYKDRILRSVPNCPVSAYSADGLGSNNEDLAEAGRILLHPIGGDRNPGKCVDEKLALLKNLLAECK